MPVDEAMADPVVSRWWSIAMLPSWASAGVMIWTRARMTRLASTRPDKLNTRKHEMSAARSAARRRTTAADREGHAVRLADPDADSAAPARAAGGGVLLMMGMDGPASATGSGFQLTSTWCRSTDEEAAIRPFLERVVPIVERVTPDYEIILVNDGSTDRTMTLLLEQGQANRRIKIVDLTRNFGKERALTAGIDHASRDAIIPLNADLQDPPDLIPEMVEKWLQGYDMVVAIRSDRRSDTLPNPALRPAVLPNLRLLRRCAVARERRGFPADGPSGGRGAETAARADAIR